MVAGVAGPGGVFAAVVQWQAVHGRHGLPWQGSPDPYRVWLSEIMLQQTQVSTVSRYYPVFLARFPDVTALAQADVDEVLSLWSGLGYYSRARNLHQCAKRVVSDYAGAFPARSDVLARLPGIGPSTAAAIAAFCFGERTSIFDGNVKRVMARFLGFGEDLSGSAASQRLLALTQAMVPTDAAGSDMGVYTQGLMDLGATLCTRSRPACLACPLAEGCVARRTGQQAVLPLKTRRVKRQTLSLYLLVVRKPDGSVGLERRPAEGIWASLWCFPEFSDRSLLSRVLGVLPMPSVTDWPVVRHALTHRELVLHPVVCEVAHNWEPPGSKHAGAWQWVAPGQPVQGGIPVPVRSLLAQLANGCTPPAL